jgi:geranylgeranyl pyrophosphate synthase
VFDFLDELVGSLQVPAGHRDLLRIHLEEGREQAREIPDLAATQLPLLVHGAITGEEASALPLAAACTLVYLGADLLDNVADDELPPRWASRSAGEATLAAATFLAALPTFALEQLSTGPSRLWSIDRTLARGLVEMSAGQHEDLGPTESFELSAGRAVAERKSGAEFACFGRAAALLAGADAAVADAYAACGAAFGTAAQIASDVSELYRGTGRRDLRNRKRPLPVMHALATLSPAERAKLERSLDSTGPGAVDELREQLRSARSFQYATLVVEVYVRRGLAALAAARGREPAAGELRALLEGASLLRGSHR